jgi:predicted ATPase/DNA-binding winged helix-turn-helix (wHTH) protein
LDPVIYHCGDCELDGANRTFKRAGTPYTLEPKVLAVLLQLVSRPKELVTREQLLDAVWGHRYVTYSTLNRVIGLARRALADDADAPTFIHTVHGAGYRYVGPVERAGSLAEPRARFGPPAAARLPAPLSSLLGREVELKQIEELLRGGRSLTILGTGGMGKTQCALAFAHSRKDAYPDGVWFFDLAPLRCAEDWLQALALSLGIAPAGDGELLPKIAESMADRRALLFLDNCDHLSPQIGPLVIELLRRTQHLKVLATSQQQLRFVSERLLRMPPLALPEIRHASDEAELHRIAAAPAVALLLERVRDARSEFKLSTANAAAIVAICERLDGMPLALELAAVRFALLSPEQVLDRLDQRFRFLVSDAAGRDQRHRNLIALLEWGYALLSPDEQRLLAWLGVFVQGWTVDAVMDLAPAFGASAELAVDLLTGLADKSLATVEHNAAPPRYRLLESVREFALEKLQALGDERRARAAHLAYVLRLTEAAYVTLLGSRMRAQIALLMREHGNIEAASEYASGPGADPQAAMRITGNLIIYFKAHGDSLLGKRLCDRALAHQPHVVSRELALTFLCRGVGNLFTEKKDTAKAPLLEAARLARQMNDPWTEAYARGHLALLLTHLGQPSDAVEHAEVTAQLAQAQGDEILLGLAGLVRGWLSLASENVEAALAELRAVRDLGFESHQHHFIGMYIGLSLFRLGDYAAAAREWQEALRNANAVSHLRGAAGSVEGCAYIAERCGHAEEACRFLGAAEQIRQRAQSPLFSFWYRHHAAAQAALRSQLGDACYQTAVLAGARMHSEDAINQAALRLRQFGQSLEPRQG